MTALLASATGVRASGAVLAVDPRRVRPSVAREGLGDLEQLTASVARHGVLVPLLVHAPRAGELQVIDGDRRRVVARHLGLDAVPALLMRRHTRAEALLVGLAANLHRAPLTAVGRGEVLRRVLVDIDPRAVAERLGLDVDEVRALAAGRRLLREVHAAARDTAPTHYPPTAPGPPPSRAARPVPPPRIAPSAVYDLLSRLGGRMAPEVRGELEALLQGWTPPARARAAT